MGWVGIVLGLAMVVRGAVLAALGGPMLEMGTGFTVVLAAMLVLRAHPSPGIALLAVAAAANLGWALLELHARGWVQAWTLDVAIRIGVLGVLLAAMGVALARLGRRRDGAVRPGSTRLY